MSPQRRGFMGGLRRDVNRVLGRTRGKCRFGPSHESCSKVGDFWLGESTNMYGCVMGPRDLCPRCEGRGAVPLTPEELAAAGDNAPPEKRCPTCHGECLVLGPHHPWRHEHPGSLPLELLR